MRVRVNDRSPIFYGFTGQRNEEATKRLAEWYEDTNDDWVVINLDIVGSVAFHSWEVDDEV